MPSRRGGRPIDIVTSGGRGIGSMDSPTLGAWDGGGKEGGGEYGFSRVRTCGDCVGCVEDEEVGLLGVNIGELDGSRTACCAC